MMIFSQKSKKIKNLIRSEKIDDKTIIAYYQLENGDIDVSIIPETPLTDKLEDRLFKYINNPKELFKISNCSGQVFHGDIEYAPCNSNSCKRYVERFLDYLNLLYIYVEQIRYFAFTDEEVDKDDLLNHIAELEKQCRENMALNSKYMAKIWKHRSKEVKYGGESLESIYYNPYSGRDDALDFHERFEYCLASGIDNIAGLYGYGGYGGVVSYLFIGQLYGKKAADVFGKESIECNESLQYADSIHKRR